MTAIVTPKSLQRRKKLTRLATKQTITHGVDFKVFIGGRYKVVELEKEEILEIAHATKQVQKAVTARSKSAPYLLRREVTK